MAQNYGSGNGKKRKAFRPSRSEKRMVREEYERSTRIWKESTSRWRGPQPVLPKEGTDEWKKMLEEARRRKRHRYQSRKPSQPVPRNAPAITPRAAVYLPDGRNDDGSSRLVVVVFLIATISAITWLWVSTVMNSDTGDDDDSASTQSVPSEQLLFGVGPW
ncbi:hypothetical protein COV06_03695 [Candidatus Uhrbacteria bacterium CG10_big_fil_rev_8_21_14_0_10_50_16]|uniref:Uncharacterized protein n=1 Tax=Candidatus Uhrbacteria bacterium CG10_big_fil_rev_8_21_14_0_10_50_16 TaxID=1975039 RepID=A0A2H0RM59_9BACT|nr:MAG: hypothetical protein COV06_03695 [Candidatus Uhrbacteria bacterium CG10_big_fil_rev_8_21_14_0_10_50_16]